MSEFTKELGGNSSKYYLFAGIDTNSFAHKKGSLRIPIVVVSPEYCRKIEDRINLFLHDHYTVKSRLL